MAALAATLRRSALDGYFKFAENGTTLGRDTMAGVTTFIVMSYIIFLNPAILGLGGDGLPLPGALTSTCLVAGVMTIIMGVYTNRAYAIAPGLGINAIVAFSLVLGAGLGFPEAMGIIVMEGALVTILVLVGMREKIMRAIPLELKKAIAIGIGLFIAFIGLYDSGLPGPLHDVAGPGHALRLDGHARAPRSGLPRRPAGRHYRHDDPGDPDQLGDRLQGVHGTRGRSVAQRRRQQSGLQPGGQHQLRLVRDARDCGDAGVDLLPLPRRPLRHDGDLVGVGKQAGYLTKDGELPEIRKPLLVDSVAAMAGGAASASSATTYIESGAGVGAGGRTGWVAVVCGALFFPFMFFAPLIGMVPLQATAPALIIVGYLMMTALSEAEERAEPAERRVAERKLAGIDFSDLALGFSAAITILVMPFTFSITNGIGFGFISYAVIRIAQGEWRRVHPLPYAVAGGFILYFLIPLLQDNLSWV